MLRKKIILLTSILIFTSVACSFGLVESLRDQLPDELNNLVADPGQIATLVLEEVEELSQQESNLESVQPVIEDDLGYGLSELDSFRINMMQSFNGLDPDGQETIITVTNTQEVIKPLKIVHMVLKSESNARPLEIFEVYRFGNEVYYLDFEETSGITECSAYTEDLSSFDTDENDLGLSLIFSNVALGEMVEEGVVVNGITANQYKVINVEMVNSELSNVEGDIWYAQDGGYIVRFDGSAKGESHSDLEEIQVTGTINWEFSLSDVNQITDIPLPEQCRLASVGGVNDIPVPENALDVSKIGSMLSLDSPDAAADLAEYYRQEMNNLGYSLTDETVYEDFYLFTFLKAEETITIIIAGTDNGGSDATIIVEVK